MSIKPNPALASQIRAHRREMRALARRGGDIRECAKVALEAIGTAEREPCPAKIINAALRIRVAREAA